MKSSIVISSELPAKLAARLTGPLPGWRAQAPLAPELTYGRHQGPPAPTARTAAVLMLLYPIDGAWHLPLTVRPLHLPTHGGQISLPGGRLEPGESSREAALRELDEELGIRAGVELLGKLSPFYVYISNTRVLPWVGVLQERPAWRPNPHEVETLLEVPLSALLDPAHLTTFQIELPHLCYRAPCFLWQDYRIWGATSMMLNELVEVVREVG